MDDELKALALLAIKNAFWHNFSALVNQYEAAGAGLETTPDQLLYSLGDLTSVFGVDRSVEADTPISLWTGKADSSTTVHQTMVEALEHKGAISLYLGGKMVFEKVAKQWQYVEGRK